MADQRRSDKQVVAAVPDGQGHIVVVCSDGSTYIGHYLGDTGVDGYGTFRWLENPPVPGTVADARRPA